MKLVSLKEKSDFSRMKLSKRKLYTGFATVVFAEKPKQEEFRSLFRMGIIVTKKIANAVGRNKIRRRLRSALRMSLADIERSPDLYTEPNESTLQFFDQDLLFIAKRALLNIEFASLVGELTQLLIKIKKPCA